MLMSAQQQQQIEGSMEGEEEDYMNYNQDTFEDDENDPFFDSDDDEECSWWSGDEVLNSDYDGQDIIPLPMDPNDKNNNNDDIINDNDQKEGTISVQCLDPKATDNNNKQLTSDESKPNIKSWVCEHCNAINNLYHSIERGYECRVCQSEYRPGQLLIESKEEDDIPLYNSELYTVWICNKCTWSNDIKWSQCSMCSQKRPSPNKLKIIQIDEKPVRFEKYDIDYSNPYNNPSIPQQYKPYQPEPKSIPISQFIKSAANDKPDCHQPHNNNNNNNNNNSNDNDILCQSEHVEFEYMEMQNQFIYYESNNSNSNNNKSEEIEVNQFKTEEFEAFGVIQKSMQNLKTCIQSKKCGGKTKKQCVVMSTAFRLFDELQNWKNRTFTDTSSGSDNDKEKTHKHKTKNKDEIENQTKGKDKAKENVNDWNASFQFIE